MKPLNQYPKHKRKKIEQIRLINEIRAHHAYKVADTNVPGFNYDVIEAAIRQIRNPHNLPIWPKGKECIYACKCGKKINVVVNKYDNSNSGIGRCECGATMYVN